MYIILAAVLAVLGGVLLGLSAFFGSAIYGTPWISDWTLNAAQACIWLAMAVFLGYFLAGCWNEIRSMR
ncbi:MAG TPA: hypothetical protein VKG24_17020 [Pseudolabrys sp.]|nr:hypothetical protein [Pseudolabrys sp.]